MCPVSWANINPKPAQFTALKHEILNVIIAPGKRGIRKIVVVFLSNRSLETAYSGFYWQHMIFMPEFINNTEKTTSKFYYLISVLMGKTSNNDILLIMIIYIR